MNVKYLSKNIECPLGCGFSSDKKTVEEKHYSQCKKVYVKCQVKDCQEVKKRENINGHMAFCPESFKDCPQKCGMSIKKKDFGDHLVSVCPKSKVTCKLCEQ